MAEAMLATNTSGSPVSLLSGGESVAGLLRPCVVSTIFKSTYIKSDLKLFHAVFGLLYLKIANRAYFTLPTETAHIRRLAVCHAMPENACGAAARTFPADHAKVSPAIVQEPLFWRDREADSFFFFRGEWLQTCAS